MPRPSAPWHSAQPRVSKRYLPCLSATGSLVKGTGTTLISRMRWALRVPSSTATATATAATRTSVTTTIAETFRSRFNSASLRLRSAMVPEQYHQLMIEPSQWVVRWAPSIRPGGVVLDVACGSGRHAKWLAQMGFEVEAVDRDLSGFGEAPANVTLLEADIESGPWPYEGRSFDAIVVTNYLHRPLLPRLVPRAWCPLHLRDLREGKRTLRQAFEPRFPAGAGGTARSGEGQPQGAR